MVEKKVTIKNMTGLDLGPAGNLCNVAMQFRSSITFAFDGGSANAKSILSILGSTIACGDEITLHCEGPDEVQALETVAKAIEDGLGE
ncbi:MAG: HPr family phosphocarrier protein [Lachnospiraceae bacterium]|nr:HPr family phosphocarrier protein [Lachnospiraceae bacterium]